VTSLKDGSRTNREILKASIATVVFAFPRSNPLYLFAEGANRAIGPALFFHVQPCGFRIREHFEELESANRCVFHIRPLCLISTYEGIILDSL
jgi:hypothetical protein